MSDPEPRTRRAEAGTHADEEYAEPFLAGYAEGVRSALKDLIGQASRGHTVGELRMLMQSRLAHLPEEIELRRQRLLATPQVSPWAPVLAPTGPPRPWGGGGGVTPRPAAGTPILFREDRPRRAVELADSAAGRFDGLVVVSPDPPAFPSVSPERLHTLLVDPTSPTLTLESLAGRLNALLQTPGAKLVYLDAIETISLQDGGETAVRFVNWVLGQARAAGSAVVATIHPRALTAKDQSLLERAFQVVL